jgi:hypothetical protein
MLYAINSSLSVPTKAFQANGLGTSDFQNLTSPMTVNNKTYHSYDYVKDVVLTLKGNERPAPAPTTSTRKPTTTTKTTTKKTTNTAAPAKTSIKKVTAKKKALKITWRKKSCNGYQVQVSTKLSFPKSARKSKTVLGGSKGSVTIKGLKKKKKYYVRVRTFRTVGSGIKYSAWSNLKMKKTK